MEEPPPVKPPESSYFAQFKALSADSRAFLSLIADYQV